MGIKHTVPAGLPTGTVSGKVAGDDWRADHNHIPFEHLIFHGGISGNTAAITAAGTVELPTAPMARLLTDLSLASQMRLILGLKATTVLGSGGAQFVRLRYSTNGATQTTWANCENTGSGVSMVGTANAIKDGGWVDLVSGAKINDCYLQLAMVTTATITTGGTLSWAAVLFR